MGAWCVYVNIKNVGGGGGGNVGGNKEKKKKKLLFLITTYQTGDCDGMKKPESPKVAL